MRLQLTSDVHTEFHADRGAEWLRGLDPSGVDVLIVAGDLTLEPWLPSVLSGLCERYPHVVYVTGNHEYYRSSRLRIYLLLTELSKRLSNLHWLNDSTVEIDGQRFIGGTLWFPHIGDGEDERLQSCLADFSQIEGFERWVYTANREAKAFLSTNLRPTDVVVTHHLPHKVAIAPQWSVPPMDKLNRFFLSDMSALIAQVQPQLWCFGHTHAPIDARIGCTRLLCNPLGYPSEGGQGYKDKLVVEL